MEYWNNILAGISWFFSLPPVNQILGAFIAAIFGLAAFFLQNNHREKTEKRRIARALLQEMILTCPH